MDKKFIAIDFGAESARIIVGILSESKLTMEELYRFPTQGTMVHGQLRWDVIRFWKEIKEGLKIYVQKYGKDADGIGIDSWGVTPVGLNQYDQLAFVPFHYRADLIADPMFSQFKDEIGEDLIFKTTGIQFVSLNTSTQLFAMEKKFPELLDYTKTIFLIPDYFYFLLTKKKITEYTNASTSQMLDVFKRDWDMNLVDKITKGRITREKIPPIISPGQKVGEVIPEVQKETGIGNIPLYSVATHDTGSAIAAIPHTDESKGWAYLSSGTWSLLGIETPEPIVNDSIQKYNLTNEGGVEGTIRLLKNIMGLWLLQTCKREWESESGNEIDYSTIVDEAKQVPDTYDTLIFPDYDKFFNPESMVTEITEYCKKTGQTPPNTQGEMALCIFNSLACRYREIMEIFEEVSGKSIEQLHIVGGGSKNELLSQITADITKKSVITGPVECTAIGNLLMQAKASGDIKDLQELRQIVQNSFEVKEIIPNDDKKENLEQLYEKFKKLER